MNPYRVTLAVVLLGLFCTFWISDALAQLHDWNGSRTSPGSIYKRGPNGLPFNVDTGRYVGIDSAPGGGASLKGRYAGSLAGRALAIESAQLVPGSALARMGVGLARSAGPLGLAMTLAPLVWDEVSDQWLSEPDLSPDSYPVFEEWTLTYSSTARWSSVADFCHQIWANLGFPIAKQSGGSGWCESAVGQSSTQWADGRVTRSRTCPSGGTVSGVNCVNAPSCAAGYGYDTTTRQCVESVGSPVSDDELEDAIYVELVARGMGSDLARRLIQAGYEPSLIGDAGPVELSGPSSVEGGTTSSTTTGPSGTTTTNTTTNYNLTYEGDTVTVTQNTTTTTTRPDGSTETTTETKTPAPGTDSPAPSQTEQTPFCELYPDASACQPLGDPGTQDLGTETRSVQLDYDGAAGSCPAPHMMNLQGKPVSFSYDPLCDFARGIRPLVIALSMLFAGLFLLSVGRSQ